LFNIDYAAHTLKLKLKVGKRSSVQDFLGDCMMSRRTSSSLHSDSADSDTPADDDDEVDEGCG